MNRYTALLIAALLALVPSAFAAEMTAPDVLARNVTNDVVRIVKHDRDIASGNLDKIHKLVEQKVLPIFDFRRMAELAMGKNWGKATPEQQQELVAQFRSLLVRTYSGALANVAEYKIDFRPLKLAAGDDDVTVSSEVTKPGVPPIPIDYRLEKQDAGWKVVDVKVEGASLVTVYRNSFNSEIRRGGIEGLLASLQRRNKSNEGVR